MKKLITTAITNTIAMPVKSGTLDFLQDAYQEALLSIATNLVGGVYNSSLFYILYGCVNSGSGLDYDISAGAIYYDGEVYLVPAATFTAGGGEVAVGGITITQYTTNADPVEFSDGVSRNVHNVRRIVFASGLSGSGIIDFADLLLTSVVLGKSVVDSMPASVTIKFTNDLALFFADAPVDTSVDFDLTNAVPGTVVRMKWAYGAGQLISVAGSSGGLVVIFESGDLLLAESNTNILYFLYVGKNENGDDEISYCIKQPI